MITTTTIAARAATRVAPVANPAPVTNLVWVTTPGHGPVLASAEEARDPEWLEQWR